MLCIHNLRPAPQTRHHVNALSPLLAIIQLHLPRPSCRKIQTPMNLLCHGTDLICIRHRCRAAHARHQRKQSNRQLPLRSWDVETLRANVDRLDRRIDEVEGLLKTFPSAVPSEISTTFCETFAAVRDTLESAEGSFSITFATGVARWERSSPRLFAHFWPRSEVTK